MSPFFVVHWMVLVFCVQFIPTSIFLYCLTHTLAFEETVGEAQWEHLHLRGKSWETNSWKDWPEKLPSPIMTIKLGITFFQYPLFLFAVSRISFPITLKHSFHSLLFFCIRPFSFMKLLRLLFLSLFLIHCLITSLLKILKLFLGSSAHSSVHSLPSIWAPSILSFSLWQLALPPAHTYSCCLGMKQKEK